MGSRLEQLVQHDLLSDVAFYVATNDFLGRSSDLVSLLCTSTTIHSALNVETNPLLYARIFGHKFDTNAPSRRLGPAWMENGCCATELRKRYTALNRIRNPRLCCTSVGDGLVDDLWTAYLMLLENDGKNEAQLLDGAHLQTYLSNVVAFKASVPRANPHNWFSDVEGTSLVLWLMWMTHDKAYIAREPQKDRTLILALLREFVVAGFRFPSFHAPDTHQLLPLDTEFTPTPAPSACGPQPPARTLVHFSRPIRLSAPPLGGAAQLLLASRYSVILPANAGTHNDLSLPRNRAEAEAIGHRGATIADFDEFEASMTVHSVERCRVPSGARNTPQRDSSRHDHDWGRIVSCHDFYARPTILRENVYSPGMLSGCWRGFYMAPDWMRYTTMIQNPARQPASGVSWALRPFYCRLREHHCLGQPNWPIPTGSDDKDWGDDISNAWLPRWASPIRETETGIEIYDHEYSSTTCYTTYRSGQDNPYRVPPRTSSSLGSTTLNIDDKWGPTYTSDGCVIDGTLPSSPPSASEVPMDIDCSTGSEELVETVQRKSSGVSDIIITGETGSRYGDAWGHFKIIGRVRPWDGLVVLLRINPNDATGGRWLFRGYVYNDNLVGRWREAHVPAHRLGYEGTFTLSRSAEQW